MLFAVTHPARVNIMSSVATYNVRSKKLTPRQVRNMRVMRHRKRLSYRKLGKLFGVSDVTARFACIGKTWKNVPGPKKIINLKHKAGFHGKAVSDANVMAMREARRLGMTYVQIAKQFGLSDCHAARICKGLARWELGGYIDIDGARYHCVSCGIKSWADTCPECKRRG